MSLTIHLPPFSPKAGNPGYSVYTESLNNGLGRGSVWLLTQQIYSVYNDIACSSHFLAENNISLNVWVGMGLFCVSLFEIESHVPKASLKIIM